MDPKKISVYFPPDTEFKIDSKATISKGSQTLHKRLFGDNDRSDPAVEKEQHVG